MEGLQLSSSFISLLLNRLEFQLTYIFYVTKRPFNVIDGCFWTTQNRQLTDFQALKLQNILSDQVVVAEDRNRDII